VQSAWRDFLDEIGDVSAQVRSNCSSIAGHTFARRQPRELVRGRVIAAATSSTICATKKLFRDDFLPALLGHHHGSPFASGLQESKAELEDLLEYWSPR
jgi:hypothetical protein